MTTRADLLAQLDAALSAEMQTAKRMGSKLVWAAIGDVERVLRVTKEENDGAGDDKDFAARLLTRLQEARCRYKGLWYDEYGAGTSTFARMIDLVEHWTPDGSEAG